MVLISVHHSNYTEHRIVMRKYVRSCHCYTYTQQILIHSHSRSFQNYFKDSINVKHHSQKHVTQFTVIKKMVSIKPQTQYLNLYHHRNDIIKLKYFTISQNFPV